MQIGALKKLEREWFFDMGVNRRIFVQGAKPYVRANEVYMSKSEAAALEEWFTDQGLSKKTDGWEIDMKQGQFHLGERTGSVTIDLTRVAEDENDYNPERDIEYNPRTEGEIGSFNIWLHTHDFTRLQKENEKMGWFNLGDTNLGRSF